MVKQPKSSSKKTDLDNYAVEYVDIGLIKPSPENDDIYGKTTNDDQMEFLIDSIKRRGLEEPLILSQDNFIISGHRRFFALQQIYLMQNRKKSVVPIRRKPFTRESRLSEWHKILSEYNPQRIKSVGSLLKESLLRHASDDAWSLLKNREDISCRGDAEFSDVDGTKTVRSISEKKQEFLAAVKKVVFDLKPFWPVTIRQVHYNLLNNPPLITTPKRSKFDREHYRYRNDSTSYDALIDLLKPARYEGHIPMHCIDDPTRPRFIWNGYSSLGSFVETEMSNFLCGYHYDRQRDQPRHIEVFGEKNTLIQILKPVCSEFYIPLSLGRGYCSLPVWLDIAQRFRKSGKDAMTLIVFSDYDPEGLDLGDDAIRTLRDLWGIPVDYHRVGVNREQIDDLGIAEDFNPAKESSSRFNAFVERTGGEKTWELEALPPQYLQDLLREAILENMDGDIYEKTVEREQNEAEELQRIRLEIVDSFNF